MSRKYLPNKNYVGVTVPIYQQPISRFDFEGLAVIKKIIENDENTNYIRATVHFLTDQDNVTFERKVNKKDLEGKGE